MKSSTLKVWRMRPASAGCARYSSSGRATSLLPTQLRAGGVPAPSCRPWRLHRCKGGPALGVFGTTHELGLKPRVLFSVSGELRAYLLAVGMIIGGAAWMSAMVRCLYLWTISSGECPRFKSVAMRWRVIYVPRPHFNQFLDESSPRLICPHQGSFIVKSAQRPYQQQKSGRQYN
jgi:hypothetical protein